MPVAHEASHGTQGAWVCTHQDEVATLVDKGGFSSCRSAPKHEDEVVASTIEGSNGSVREGLPTLATMAESLMLPDGEARVEQEDALLCPTSQVAALWDGCSRLGLYLLEDVLERGRELYAVVDAEAESVRLSWAVIGVLTEDDDTHLVERCRIEGVEDEPTGRVASPRRVLLSHELRQLLEVRLAELFGKLLLPRRLYLYVHS